MKNLQKSRLFKTFQDFSRLFLFTTDSEGAPRIRAGQYITKANDNAHFHLQTMKQRRMGPFRSRTKTVDGAMDDLMSWMTKPVYLTNNIFHGHIHFSKDEDDYYMMIAKDFPDDTKIDFETVKEVGRWEGQYGAGENGTGFHVLGWCDLGHGRPLLFGQFWVLGRPQPCNRRFLPFDLR